MPARRALDNLWMAARVWAGVTGTTTVIVYIAYQLLGDDNVPWISDEDFAIGMFAGFVSVSLCLFYTDERRWRIKAFLSSMEEADKVRKIKRKTRYCT